VRWVHNAHNGFAAGSTMTTGIPSAKRRWSVLGLLFSKMHLFGASQNRNPLIPQ